MRRLIVLMTAASLLAGCGAAGTEIDEVGTWSVSGDGIAAVATYSSDGTYSIAPVVDGTALSGFDMGSYEVDGETLVYTSSAAAMGCEEGDVGRYEIEVADSDSWTLFLIEDMCEKRADGGPFAHSRTE